MSIDTCFHGHLLVITGYFYGIIHSINGVFLVLITGITRALTVAVNGHNYNMFFLSTATPPSEFPHLWLPASDVIQAAMKMAPQLLDITGLLPTPQVQGGHIG